MQPDIVPSGESLEPEAAIEPEVPFLQSRYPGSLPFQDYPLHHLMFFGREIETETLLHKILAEDLVVFYSRSGLGKTSLLNAGILPRLRERGYFPLMCRVYAPWQNGHSQDSLPDPLTSVYGFIEQETDKGLSNGVLTDLRAGQKKTMWEYFKTLEVWSADDILLTPVLILDQFEELFTFYSREQRQAFALELADLLRGSIPKSLRDEYRGKRGSSKPFPYTEAPPKVKVLISLREEYLGYLAELAHELPAIRKSEFRLTPMQRANAERAIVEPARMEDKQLLASATLTPPFSYAPETLREILDFLCDPEEKGVEDNEVDPSQLQLLCQDIEEKVRERVSLHPGKKVMVDRSILHGREEMRALIQGFYERVIGKIPEPQRRRVIDLFENEQRGLISPTGKRLSLAQEVIEHQFQVSEDLLKELQEKRLLRSEHRLGEFYYELSHDTLIKPIQETKKNRAEKKARRRRRKIQIIVSSLVVIIGVIIYFEFGMIKLFFGPPQYKIAHYEKIGDQNFKSGNFVAARENFEIAVILAKETKGQTLARLYLKLADLHEAMADRNCQDGNFAAARENFEKAIRLAKEIKGQNLPTLYMKLADSYLHLGDHGEAISNYWKAVSILNEKQRGPALFGLGNAYAAQGSFKKAIVQYEKAMALDPNNPSLLNLAIAYLKDGRRKAALEIVNRLNGILDRNPNLLGMEQGYFELIQAGGEGLAPVHGQLGKIYLGQRKFDLAKNEFEKAVAIAKKENDPNLPKYYLNLGESYLALNQYENAISSYQEGLKSGLKDQDLGKTYLGLGNAYSALKNPSQAIMEYERAVKFDPSNGYAFIYLAGAYLKDGQTQKACENLIEAKKIAMPKPGVITDPYLKHAMENLEAACKVPENPVKGPQRTN